MMQLPGALCPGSIIGVFAPSSPGALHYQHRFQRGVVALATCFQCEVVFPPGFEHPGKYTAGTPFERARSFLALLEDPRVRAIFTTYGGYNCSDILSLLPPAVLRAHPKILVGYSDTTSLLLAYQAITGYVTYYGPAVLPQFGEYPEPFAYTLQRACDILVRGKGGKLFPPAYWTDEFLDWNQPDKERARTLTKDEGPVTWREGTGEGRLFGGNVSTLNYLIGTPYFQPPPGSLILFIEGTAEDMHVRVLRRSLVQLCQIGLMEHATALLIGRIPSSSIDDMEELKRMVLDVTQDYPFPVLGQLPFGHSDPMVTLPIGCIARVMATELTVELEIEGPTALV